MFELADKIIDVIALSIPIGSMIAVLVRSVIWLVKGR